MRRRASIVPWCLSLILLSIGGGCGSLSARKGSLQEIPTREQATQAQQISERAQEAFDRGDFEQARTELLQLVALSPRAAEAHQRLGKVLELEGRISEADACFRRALEIDADYTDALIGLGSIEAARGNLPSALKRYQTAIEIEPHNAEAHFARGQTLEAMGKTDDALAAYFRTLEFNPLRAQVNHRIGAIQLARNQPDQALARLDQAVDLDGTDGELRLLRGRAHLSLRHIPEAIADFRAAAIRLPDRADVYFQLAVALEAAHQKADALQAAEQALRLAPDYADARDLSRRLR